MKPVITELGPQHDRTAFDCGAPALNQFLQRLARQQSARDFSKTYVACLPDAPQILGFYAISSGSVDFAHWPVGLRLPRYPVPVARLGRLAVDRRSQGQGVGAVLLSHAVSLALQLSERIGLYALVVDAKDEAAVAFYLRHGFAPFPDRALTLFLTLDMARRARQAASVAPGAPHQA
jgi:GNAT superfamily N-acetyltransferase